MEFFVLQTRQAGDCDSSITVYATEEEAKHFARAFLQDYVPHEMKASSLEEMMYYCWDQDLAYASWSFHQIKR